MHGLLSGWLNYWPIHIICQFCHLSCRILHAAAWVQTDDTTLPTPRGLSWMHWNHYRTYICLLAPWSMWRWHFQTHRESSAPSCLIITLHGKPWKYLSIVQCHNVHVNPGLCDHVSRVRCSVRMRRCIVISVGWGSQRDMWRNYLQVMNKPGDLFKIT